MTRAPQHTLAAPFERCGRGLHTNAPVRVRVEPAEDGAGVVFHRRLPGRRGRTLAVPARWERRVPRPLCTALAAEEDGRRIVRTVEHLLAAFAALGVDNARVELDAEELPIFDGSALPWVTAVAAVGRRAQSAPRRSLRVLRTVQVEAAGRSLRVTPHADGASDGLHLDCALQLSRFPPMRWEGWVTPATFIRDLAPARSFGRLKWAAPLRLYALLTGRAVLRGAGLHSTAAVWGGRVLGGMATPDEFVRHRALDLVGDLALTPAPLSGRVEGERVGHELNHALVARLMATPGAWALA